MMENNKNLSPETEKNEQVQETNSSLVYKKDHVDNQVRPSIFKVLTTINKRKRRHEGWKYNIEYVNKDVFNKIIEASKDISVEIKKDKDRNTLYSIDLGGKKYTIKLVKKMTQKYWSSPSNDILLTYIKPGANTIDAKPRPCTSDIWNRKKLPRDIEKQEEKKEKIYILLNKLGEKAGLTYMPDQIAMLMYLTGLNGYYFVLREYDNYLQILECSYDGRRGIANDGGGWLEDDTMYYTFS